MTHSPVSTLPALSVRHDGPRDTSRPLPEEVPVALVFDGTTQAVMMATPTALEDFAVGFALTEGFIASTADIAGFELARHELGIEARFWLAGERAAALRTRRRQMAGPVGCGLCGIDSLAEAMRPLPRVTGDLRLGFAMAAASPDALAGQQPLHDRTRAVHAAGFLTPRGGVIRAREDVGRHNALDKLIGSLARDSIDPATGAFVLTSRLSVELLQKTAMAGCPVLIAVSAPTALAVRLAETAGITLAAFANRDGLEIYTHPQRIETGAPHVA